jgi:uncharacterized repeat protein (TIGR01451 family)
MVGETVEFTIYVWNNGPGVAQNVNLTDTLGSCFQFVSSDPSRNLGDMAEGAAYVVAFDALVVNNSACSSRNTASISSSNGICSPASCSDTASVTIPGGGGPSAALGIEKAPSIVAAVPTATWTPQNITPPTSTRTPQVAAEPELTATPTATVMETGTIVASSPTSTVSPTPGVPTSTWTEAFTATSTHTLVVSNEPVQTTATTTPNPTTTPSSIGAAPRPVNGSPTALALPLTLLFLPILMSLPGMENFFQWANARSRP